MVGKTGHGQRGHTGRGIFRLLCRHGDGTDNGMGADQRALIALSISECASNCVRHADGTELYVCFWQKPDCIAVSLTNNGAAPKGKITEGGGLSMLRQRIEESGGKMEIQSVPRFKLMLSLQEKEEAAYEGDDR